MDVLADVLAVCRMGSFWKMFSSLPLFLKRDLFIVRLDDCLNITFVFEVCFYEALTSHLIEAVDAFRRVSLAKIPFICSSSSNLSLFSFNLNGVVVRDVEGFIKEQINEKDAYSESLSLFGAISVEGETTPLGRTSTDSCCYSAIKLPVWDRWPISSASWLLRWLVFEDDSWLL